MWILLSAEIICNQFGPNQVRRNHDEMFDSDDVDKIPQILNEISFRFYNTFSIRTKASIGRLLSTDQ